VVRGEEITLTNCALIVTLISVSTQLFRVLTVFIGG
jgi:hypothetical protein